MAKHLFSSIHIVLNIDLHNAETKRCNGSSGATQRSDKSAQPLAGGTVDQIQLGIFEYSLNHVVDNDLSVFESHYRNDVNAAPG
ncbi:hypothetical protein [Nitrincola iocasae]|uniref:Uncharacterized protein n=1 Tax=Nitrincola iocasae TaxID=2614693 RepID=A0A5J6LEL9_9GAMM|nr:hypothetical protein [Nitrincola iocasae]QEW06621.1 hypothetical protein F5I99_08955 [Nitrincola iocasae]